MLITTVCPSCETRYQVDASLQGRKIRCKEASCGEVFEVREWKPQLNGPDIIQGIPVEEAEAGSPAREAVSRSSSHVQDLVPLLPAEKAEVSPPSGKPSEIPDEAPPPKKSSREAPVFRETDWRTAPPPPRRQLSPESESSPPTDVDAPFPPASEKKDREPLPTSPSSLEEPAREEEPTPDRREPESPASLSESDFLSSSAVSLPALPSAKKRRARWLIAGLLFSMMAILGGTGLLVWKWIREGESRLAAQAEQEYQQEQYHLAAATYRKLAESYPESEQVEEYRFHQELSEVLAVGQSPSAGEAFERFKGFLSQHRDDSRLRARGQDLGKILFKQLEIQATAWRDNPHDAEARTLLEAGQQLLQELDRIDPKWVAADDRQKINDLMDQGRQKLAVEQERLDFLERLRRLLTQSPAKAVQEMRGLLRKEISGPRRWDQDAQVQELVNKIYAGHLASVTYTPRQGDVNPLPRSEESTPGLWVDPLVQGRAVSGPRDRVILALARGVLYALRQSDGEVVWAKRVGIDTDTLPVRLPPDAGRPEMALVISGDALTLSAINVRTGGTLWQYHLEAPCLGQPVIVDRRAYLSTYDGQVHEIELSEGFLLGRYHLGQSLSLGGTRLEGTRLIFFPADEYCVYLLDVANHRCLGVLYTEHGPGSLRSGPLLFPRQDSQGGPPDANTPGFLALNQSHGMDAMTLRAFRLPIQGSQTEPVPLPDLRLPGQSSFPPYHDTEKLVLVTDSGQLGLFGIVQVQNQDTPLFPLIHLPGQLPGVFSLAGEKQERCRAQVVHALENDLWVLARGWLRRLQLTLSRTAGPQVVPQPRWGGPLLLGSPLHGSQQNDQGTTFFLVTQSLTQQVCLATAVDAESGKVRWQRQLGLVCQGEPLPLESALVALDQGGGLFLFHSSKHSAGQLVQWQSGGESLAPPLPGGVSGALNLLPDPEGQAIYEIASVEPGNQLLVRRCLANSPDKLERTANLTAPLGGAPAVGSKSILLPLADGTLVRLALPLTAEGGTLAGPDWRAGNFGTEQLGYAVWLGGDDFLTTNGQRGLTWWSFDNKEWRSRPEGKNARRPTQELAYPIVAPPLVLTRPGNKVPLRLCVADASGTIHLLEGDELKPVRQWVLKGKLTAGPFLRDGKVGCVVERRRLVWLDPGKDGEWLWHYESPGGEIVGQPQLVEGVVLVAHLSGRFVGLDPVTGKPRGPGFTLKASVAPAASPVAFGPGRLFAPLTDGTVLLLSLEDFRSGAANKGGS